MTIRIPSRMNSAIINSTARVAVGSRLAVGSSRNRTSGRSDHARASARRCCSPPERTRAGRSASAGQAEAVEGYARAAIAAGTVAKAGKRQRVDEIAARRAAQHDRSLEDHGVTAAADGGARTQPFHRTRGRSDQPMTQAERKAFAGAVRPKDRRDAATAKRQVQTRNQRGSTNSVADAGQAQRQA